MKHLKTFAVICAAALSLSACAAVDVDWRGWRVTAGAALPLQVPLVENRVAEPRPPRPEVRIVHDVRTIVRTRTRTRDVECHPPSRLMRADPYWDEGYVRRYRDLQRYIRVNCQ